jgi:hypothetical protein
VGLFDGDRRIARAKSAMPGVEPPPPPTFDEAEAAVSGYLGFTRHDYPTCFVCGPERTPPDGLGLHAGPVACRSIVAAPWEPADDLLGADGHVRPELVWASLDCPSYFGHASFERVDEAVLLGRLTSEIRRAPTAGERCVVAGWSLGRTGRKIRCGSALYGADGDVCARAEATWICVARGE